MPKRMYLKNRIKLETLNLINKKEWEKSEHKIY